MATKKAIKISKLHGLGKERQGIELVKYLGKEYRNLGHKEYGNGAYECKWVSPYSISACSVDAEVMVVLLDWASHNGLMAEQADPDVLQFGYTPTAATNVNLIDLLRRHLQVELSQTFSTNLFPLIKPGGMNASIPQKLLNLAARAFCEPQIQIVQPRLVICMGIQVFNTLRRLHGHSVVANLNDGITEEASFRVGSITYWCQSHPGQLGKINRESHGRVSQVDKDWEAMAHRFLGTEDASHSAFKVIDVLEKLEAASSLVGRVLNEKAPAPQGCVKPK